MMRKAAFWGQEQGANHLAVLCVKQNEGPMRYIAHWALPRRAVIITANTLPEEIPQMADTMPTALDLPMVDPLPEATQKIF